MRVPAGGGQRVSLANQLAIWLSLLLVLQTLEAGGSGRAIVFTNYREGVMGICEALRQHDPLITAK